MRFSYESRVRYMRYSSLPWPFLSVRKSPKADYRRAFAEESRLSLIREPLRDEASGFDGERLVVEPDARGDVVAGEDHRALREGHPILDFAALQKGFVERHALEIFFVVMIVVVLRAA